MMGVVALSLLLVPGAPVPPGASGVQAGPPSAKVDTVPLNQFASLIETLANTVRDYSAPDSVTQKEFYAGAIQGLYEAVGQPVPEKVKAAIRAANTQADRLDVLRKARARLGNHPNLAGTRSLFAAMNGFRHATDPICGLAAPRPSDYASIEQDFGVGIELDGVAGTRWAIYQVEYRIATGAIVPVGYFGPLPKPDAVPSPAVFPWRVLRVIPGSPAQKAGVKPGDLITHLDGVEVTAQNMNALFARFAMPRQRFDPRTGQPQAQEWSLSFRRGDEKTLNATLKVDSYSPESAFGVWKRADGKWDCLLDRQTKIGYIRLGSIELGLEKIFAEMMADLDKQGCRGLILDLRWCPGGYVDPGMHIAGQFLPDGCVISKMEFFHPERSGRNGDVLAPPGGGKYATLPLAVIVGHETIGGGESDRLRAPRQQSLCRHRPAHGGPR